MNTNLANNRYGLILAVCGALFITPDTLFMRLSEMPAWTMMAWRGIEMGSLLLLIWGASLFWASNRQRLKTELHALLSWQGCGAIGCTVLGGSLFTYGIAETSVTIILITIACSPLFAAIFSYLFLSEKIGRASWMAILFCLFGIILAVWDGENVVAAPEGSVVIGAICGLITAAALGLSFVLLRSHAAIPLLPMNGLGALFTGCVGLTMIFTTTDAPAHSLLTGNILMISVSGLIILPLSFVALTSATRYTHAANVSLLMFLETILGPIWVWLGVGEQPGFWMIMGGTITLCALGIYLVSTMRSASS